jgi:hypothetical protein
MQLKSLFKDGCPVPDLYEIASQDQEWFNNLRDEYQFSAVFI